MKKVFLFLSFCVFFYAQEISDTLDKQNTTEQTAPQNLKEDKQENVQNKKGNIIIGIFSGINTLTTKNKYFNQLTELKGASHSTNSIALSYGLKIGYDFIIKPKHILRFYFDYSGNNFFDQASSKAYLNALFLNLDYRYGLIDLLDLFVGVHANTAFLNTQNYAQQVSFGGGINIGFILNLLPYLEFETRMRFISDSLSPIQASLDREITATNRKVEFGDLLNFSVGINFKF
ncbi:hypothetical protein LW135_05460 [Helicobacter sp. faydin-H20]|uniref:hypothetical protein n=1 Tax=Helicobacter anatolicus TaxID=2905874 RepID=UPI001E4981BD|nr:hypothetical protein [Helicobacter anatolicus]MCE3037277.1 hypothetical protein [Helicobacter anatolicus]